MGLLLLSMLLVSTWAAPITVNLKKAPINLALRRQQLKERSKLLTTQQNGDQGIIPITNFMDAQVCAVLGGMRGRWGSLPRPDRVTRHFR